MTHSLHVCWLVDDWSAARSKYVTAWAQAGWQVTLWHAGQISALPSDARNWNPGEGYGCYVRDARELMQHSPVASAFGYELRHRSHAAAADLFRFAVLHAIGGAYADLDVLPRNARISPHDPLFGMPQGAGQEIPAFQRRSGPLRSEQLEIRFVSSPARHPLIARVLAQQAINEAAFLDGGGYANGVGVIIERTGPIMVAGVVRAYAKEIGRTFGSYLVADATIDHTPENLGEHMTRRYPEILAAAARR